jgi:hypothetical protein
MTIDVEGLRALRRAITEIPGDVSNDAVGEHVARVEDMYAPETHAAALDPGSPTGGRRS